MTEILRLRDAPSDERQDTVSRLHTDLIRRLRNNRPVADDQYADDEFDFVLQGAKADTASRVLSLLAEARYPARH